MLPLAAAAAVALAVPGCGGDDSTTAGSPETPQALPELSKGWQVSRSRQAGVQAALIRSPDHLVAVTLVAARESDALEVPLEEFATSALAALPGFESQLVPSDPRPFRGTPFAAIQTTATGTTKARGIRERTTLLVLRREDTVNYTVAIVENARHRKSVKDRAVALKMMHTLRDQPVGPRERPESQ